jgi:hypothetical protein
MESAGNMLRILQAPDKFLLPTSLGFPAHQAGPMIEEFAFNHFVSRAQSVDTELVYLPIQWSAYHGSHHYGQYTADLQIWYGEIIKNFPHLKFFTIVQWAGGPLVKLPNCTIFSSGGIFGEIRDVPGWEDIEYEHDAVPIPLICDPHPVSEISNPTYAASFIGRRGHPIRDKMFAELSNVPGFLIEEKSGDTETFRKVMNDSIFSLCPRGTGPTSYRLYESVQMGRIPIYIGDDLWLPFEDKVEWKKLGLILTEDQICDIPDMVNDLIDSGKYLEYVEYGKSVWKNRFSFAGCCDTIIETIEARRI